MEKIEEISQPETAKPTQRRRENFRSPEERASIEKARDNAVIKLLRIEKEIQLGKERFTRTQYFSKIDVRPTPAFPMIPKEYAYERSELKWYELSPGLEKDGTPSPSKSKKSNSYTSKN